MESTGSLYRAQYRGGPKQSKLNRSLNPSFSRTFHYFASLFV